MNLALVYDTETSGIPLWKQPSEDPGQPHIVTISASLVDIFERRVVANMDVIVKPDGWEITEETFAIHGISQQAALRYGIPEDVAVDALYALASAADFRIGFNETFDARMIRIGLKRMQDEESAEAFKAQETFCVMRGCHKVMGGKWPKLVEAYQHFFGKPMEGAHTSRGDALATLELYYALQERSDANAVPAGDGMVGGG